MFLSVEITKRKMDKIKLNADIVSALASLRKELIGMFVLQTQELRFGYSLWQGIAHVLSNTK